MLTKPNSPIQPFHLERYFAQYEFRARYLLSPSDCESLSMQQLLELADPDSLTLWEHLSLGYTESQGNPRLLQAISTLYQSVPAENILVAAPEELIFIFMQTMLKPGDEVIVTYPGYQSLYEIANSIGCQVKPWAFQIEENHWQLDLNWLEHEISPNTRLLVVNFPHNPTGYQPSHADWQAIAGLASRSGVYLFGDEMYRGLEPDPNLQLTATCDQYERGISLTGLSKGYALPGLRIGWLATQDKSLLPTWQAYKDYTTICSSAPSEILAIMALRARQPIFDRNRSIIHNNQSTATAFFHRHPDLFAWLPPQAGSIAFPRWTGSGSVEQFCQTLLDQESVMLVPGSIFSYPHNHFRLGLGRTSFSTGLSRVEAMLANST